MNPASVKEVNVGFNLVPAMLSGKGGRDARRLLELRGHPAAHDAQAPDDDPRRSGRRAAATTSSCWSCAKTRPTRDGQDLRAFLQALTRGENEVRANPAAAAALVVKANPSLEPKLQLASIEQTLPAALPSQAGKPFGWQSTSAWAAFGSWMSRTSC